MDLDEIGPFLILVIVAVLLFACLWSGILLIARESCIDTGEVTGLTVEWRVFGGCFVKLDGRMIPYDTWQLIQIQQIDK